MSRSCSYSHLDENPLPVEDGANRHPRRAEGEGEEKGADPGIGEVVENRPEDSPVERAALAVVTGQLDPEKQQCRKSRSDEERDRVGAQPLEGLGALLPSLHV